MRRIQIQKVNETKHYFVEQMKHNELISKNPKQASLNYIEHLFILDSTITGCVSISAFPTLAGIPVRIKSSAVVLNICAIAAGIKNNIQ